MSFTEHITRIREAKEAEASLWQACENYREERSQGAAWAQALRGGNELRQERLPAIREGGYEFFPAPTVAEPERVDMHPIHINAWPDEREYGIPRAWFDGRGS